MTSFYFQGLRKCFLEISIRLEVIATLFINVSTRYQKKTIICFSRLGKKVAKKCFSKEGILWRFVIKIFLIKRSRTLVSMTRLMAATHLIFNVFNKEKPAPSSHSHKVTPRTNNTRTTALERSVVKVARYEGHAKSFKILFVNKHNFYVCYWIWVDEIMCN